ncbi:hypothetical protein J6590_030432 [Homalodisca vitripennis]|nr:hypothetical protein J6590_030432 [Homalodisca vitripennis]
MKVLGKCSFFSCFQDSRSPRVNSKAMIGRSSPFNLPDRLAQLEDRRETGGDDIIWQDGVVGAVDIHVTLTVNRTSAIHNVEETSDHPPPPRLHHLSAYNRPPPFIHGW